MNQRIQNNVENITWAPRIISRQLVFENNQQQENSTQIRILEENDFFIERLERRILIDNRQQNNITLFSYQKHPNNKITNIQ